MNVMFSSLFESNAFVLLYIPNSQIVELTRACQRITANGYRCWFYQDGQNLSRYIKVLHSM